MKVAFVGETQAKWLRAAWGGHTGAPAEAMWLRSPDDLSPSARERLRAADKIVWVAPDDPEPICAELHLKGERLWVPELRLDFLWPFGGQPHLFNTSHPQFPTGAFPVELGDAWLNRALQGLRRWEAIEQDYLALDVAALIDLDAMKRLALEAQGEIDARLGADFASRIEAGFRSGRLFAHPLAPGPELLRALAEVLFARLGKPGPLGEPPPLASPELPVHPSVAAHFGLTDGSGRRYDLLTGEPVDFAEYVRRYLAYAEGPELEAGLRREAAGQVSEALAALETATARPLGRRSLTGRRARARAALRAQEGQADPSLFAAGDLADENWAAAATHFAQRRWREAETAVLAYLARQPAHAETLALLATIREKRGDVEGAAAALELAAGLAPEAAPLLNRLTGARASQGDVWGAIRSAQAEIALDPANPLPRAYVGALYQRVGHVERARKELAAALEAAGAEHAGLRAEWERRLAGMATG